MSTAQGAQVLAMERYDNKDTISGSWVALGLAEMVEYCIHEALLIAVALYATLCDILHSFSSSEHAVLHHGKCVFV